MRTIIILFFVILFTSCNHKRNLQNEKILNTFILGEKFYLKDLDTNKLFSKSFRNDPTYNLSDNSYCIVNPVTNSNNLLTRLILLYGTSCSEYYERVCEKDKNYLLEVYRTKYGKESEQKNISNKDSLRDISFDIEVKYGLATFQIDNHNVNPIEIYYWKVNENEISLLFRPESLTINDTKIYVAIARYTIAKKNLRSIEIKENEKQKEKDLKKL